MNQAERQQRILELRRELSFLEDEERSFVLSQTNGSLNAQVRALAKTSQYEAMKHYRSVAGCSLIEARDAVYNILGKERA